MCRMADRIPVCKLTKRLYIQLVLVRLIGIRSLAMHNFPLVVTNSQRSSFIIKSVVNPGTWHRYYCKADRLSNISFEKVVIKF